MRARTRKETCFTTRQTPTLAPLPMLDRTSNRRVIAGVTGTNGTMTTTKLGATALRQLGGSGARGHYGWRPLQVSFRARVDSRGRPRRQRCALIITLSEKNGQIP